MGKGSGLFRRREEGKKRRGCSLYSAAVGRPNCKSLRADIELGYCAGKGRGKKNFKKRKGVSLTSTIVLSRKWLVTLTIGRRKKKGEERGFLDGPSWLVVGQASFISRRITSYGDRGGLPVIEKKRGRKKDG